MGGNADMRMTIDLEEDILSRVDDIARERKCSVGQIVSELVRTALREPKTNRAAEIREEEPVGGFRPLPSRGLTISNELVDRLRDMEDV
jgi:hypothetical protein